MTQRKKLKKTIRARAGKTGESYTAARRQVLLARGERVRPAPAPPPSPRPPERPTLPVRAGMSEASVVKKTGHGFDHWFAVLDAFGVPDRGHNAAATHLYEEHGVPGWYCQMITVAYEQARGLRRPNQSCTGDFQVSVSKAVPASVEAVARAFTDARRRQAWLREADPGLARALVVAFDGPKPVQLKQRDARNARLRYRWDGSVVEIRITGKATGATVVADNTKLADSGEVEHRRALWKTALEVLKAQLAR
jgi:uncharacterized protein YndB with AHSA1/START domain